MFKILGERKKMHVHSWTSFFLLYTFHGVWKQKVSFTDHSKAQVILNQLIYPVYNFFSCFNFVLQVLSSLFRDHLHLYEQNILDSFLLHLVIFLADLWSSFISCHSLIQSANLSCNCLEPFLSSRKIIEVRNLSLPYCNCKNSSKQNKPYLIDSYFVTSWLQSIQKWHLVH